MMLETNAECERSYSDEATTCTGGYNSPCMRFHLYNYYSVSRSYPTVVISNQD